MRSDPCNPQVCSIMSIISPPAPVPAQDATVSGVRKDRFCPQLSPAVCQVCQTFIRVHVGLVRLEWPPPHQQTPHAVAKAKEVQHVQVGSNRPSSSIRSLCIGQSSCTCGKFSLICPGIHFQQHPGCVVLPGRGDSYVVETAGPMICPEIHFALHSGL